MNDLILITDFDGVWTDNYVLTDSQGNESIKCTKADSLALNYFRRYCIEKSIYFRAIVVSTEQNKSISNRCKKLNLEYYQTEEDKAIIVSKILKEEFSKSKVTKPTSIYIGNDINDISSMKLVDISMCPFDSDPQVKKQSSIILNTKGGNGCIRELLIWYCKDSNIDLFSY